MTLEEALKDVQGWLTLDEATLLFDLASGVQLPQMIVEVGSYHGRSTIALALGAGTPVFAIDPHEQSAGDPFPFGDQDRAALMGNLVRTGLAWKVRLLDMRSDCAAKGWPGHRIGLLFIDGAHSKEAVDLDLFSWLPYVDDGAWVAFHDSNQPCVIDALADRTDLEYVKTVEITALYKYHPPTDLVVDMDAVNSVIDSLPMDYGVVIEDPKKPVKPVAKKGPIKRKAKK